MSKQILLIEDDPDLAELISDYLTMNYYDVHHAGLGQEGLDILDTKERDIDLVVLDLMLPDMVIDDSKTMRRTAETLLKKAGCEVITAIDGFDALAKIVDNNPDIIFVDIMMPRLDGYQTCALIKNNPNYADKPVIMLSSKDGLFDKARGRIVGSDEYLTKPFSKDELFEAISHYR